MARMTQHDMRKKMNTIEKKRRLVFVKREGQTHKEYDLGCLSQEGKKRLRKRKRETQPQRQSPEKERIFIWLKKKGNEMGGAKANKRRKK